MVILTIFPSEGQREILGSTSYQHRVQEICLQKGKIWIAEKITGVGLTVSLEEISVVLHKIQCALISLKKPSEILSVIEYEVLPVAPAFSKINLKTQLLQKQGNTT